MFPFRQLLLLLLYPVLTPAPALIYLQPPSYAPTISRHFTGLPTHASLVASDWWVPSGSTTITLKSQTLVVVWTTTTTTSWALTRVTLTSSPSTLPTAFEFRGNTIILPPLEPGVEKLDKSIYERLLAEYRSRVDGGVVKVREVYEAWDKREEGSGVFKRELEGGLEGERLEKREEEPLMLAARNTGFVVIGVIMVTALVLGILAGRWGCWMLWRCLWIRNRRVVKAKEEGGTEMGGTEMSVTEEAGEENMRGAAESEDAHEDRSARDINVNQSDDGGQVLEGETTGRELVAEGAEGSDGRDVVSIVAETEEIVVNTGMEEEGRDTVRRRESVRYVGESSVIRPPTAEADTDVREKRKRRRGLWGLF
ncbi:hypothetical protein RUND412_009362 [Rhizina undulata]